jgi:hypothetical protein
VIADQQWRIVQEEDKQNIELLDLSQRDPDADQEVRSLADPTGGAVHRAAPDKRPRA